MPNRASRDLGLRRISTSTRYLAAAAVVAGGLLSAAVARALPGRTSHSPTSGTAVPAQPGSPSTSASSSSGGAGNPVSPATTVPPTQLTTPAQVPQPVSGGTPVVSSGGS